MRIASLLDLGFMLIAALGLALAVALSPRAGTSVQARRRRNAAVWGLWVVLWLASTPAVATALTSYTQMQTPDLDTALAGTPRDRVALVVFGGGGGPRAVPTAREHLAGASPMRAITAARVWSQERFGTVIVTGSADEADGMSDLLVELGVPAELILRDRDAANTRENAAHSTALLRARGAEATVLVTSATHLRRSLKDFAALGVQAIPVASEPVDAAAISLVDFMPSAAALGATQTALHELLGYLRG